MLMNIDLPLSKCSCKQNCDTLNINYSVELFTGSSHEERSRVSVLYTGHVKEPGLSCVMGAPVYCTLGHL